MFRIPTLYKWEETHMFRILTLCMSMSLFGLSMSSTLFAAEPLPPAPPQDYALPANPTYVTTTAEFETAFASSGSKDIVLRDGTYANSTYLCAGGSHRVWAEHLGKAVLSFGLCFSTPRCEVHGIKFDVTNDANALNGMVITSWSNGAFLTVTDCWIYGHRACDAGIFARATNGLVVKRCILNGFTGYGLAWMAYSPAYRTDSPAVAPVIEDIDVSTVYSTPKGSMDGTGEAGIWAGTRCSVARVRITDISWMGLWTGANCNDALFSDLTIDNITPTGIGIYVERYTRRCTFQNFRIGPPNGLLPWQPDHYMKNGIVTEWDDRGASANPEGGTNAASHGNTFKNGTINSSQKGFGFEDAETTTVSGITFLNQSAAAIKEFRTYNDNYSTVWQNQSNDFTGILSSAVQRTTSHSPFGFAIQPLDIQVRPGSTATFTAKANGGYSAFRYQWQKNRVNISGATQSAYSFATVLGDNGNKYRVVATSNDGTVTSIEATLSVSASTLVTDRNIRHLTSTPAGMNKPAYYDLHGRILSAQSQRHAYPRGVVIVADPSAIGRPIIALRR